MSFTFNSRDAERRFYEKKFDSLISRKNQFPDRIKIHKNLSFELVFLFSNSIISETMLDRNIFLLIHKMFGDDFWLKCVGRGWQMGV